MIVRIVIFSILLLTSISAQSQRGDCGSNVKWNISKDGTLTISGNGEWQVSVVDTKRMSSDGFRVKAKTSEIAKRYGNKIKHVIIEDGITNVPKLAFACCSQIQSVALPNSITSIDDQAFEFCSNLKDIVIPNSVTIIGNNAFAECSDLSAIAIPNSVTQINVGAFSKCIKLRTVTLSNLITTIKGFTFYGCTSLESVDLPNAVTSIGTCAFAECTSLKSIKFPNSLSDIEEKAFEGCSGLTSITIPNSVRYIEYRAFAECTGLTRVFIPNSANHMGAYAFSGLKQLQEIIIPDEKPVYVEVKILGKREVSDKKYPMISLYDAPTTVVVKGNNIRYPAYIIDDLPHGFKAKWKETFSFYLGNSIYSKLEQWSRKKEFETNAQWRQRVNKTTQKKEADRLIEQARKNFIKEKSPKNLTGWCGIYDSEKNIFPVYVLGDTFYVKVPLKEAKSFRDQWNKVKIQPHYEIVNDRLSMTACSFVLNNKRYNLLNNYKKDSNKDLVMNLPPIDLGLNKTTEKTNNNPVIDNSLDKNIPIATTKSINTFAVIIGNENYQRVAKVQYAANDAATFATYCQKTLGIPQKNIRGYKDATFATMLSALKDIQDIAKAYKGNINVIFYYAGHGVPSEADRSAYLLPVDADGSQMDFCLSTKKLYQSLNSLNAKKVVVLMDACFSGAKRGDGMLASARGVALKVKNDVPTGNMVVFTAANGQQTAYPYKEKGHGMFTYFLLKKLRDTKGNVTLGDLTDYVSE